MISTFEQVLTAMSEIYIIEGRRVRDCICTILKLSGVSTKFLRISAHYSL